MNFRDKPWSDFLWWLLVTVGAGLLQVWALLCIILSFSFWPGARERFGNSDWGLSRILGNSVLLFFATSLLGQSIYTLSLNKATADQRGRFLTYLIAAAFIPVFILYVQTVLLGEPPVKTKYAFDIMFAAQALAYAAYVEFRLRRTPRPSAVQAQPQ